TSDRIADPRLVNLAHKVRFEIDPEIEQIYPRAFPGRVAIHLRDGRTVEQSVPGPKGSPENPMTLDEVADKSHLLVDPVLGRERLPGRGTGHADGDGRERALHCQCGGCPRPLRRRYRLWQSPQRDAHHPGV